MKMIKYFLIIMIVATSSFSCKKQNQTVNVNNQNYIILLNAETYSVGGTGYAGTPTNETIAFKNLFNDQNSKELYEKLFEEANIEGKLYALSGLYYFNKDLYQEHFKNLKDSDTSVHLFSGCFLYTRNVSEIMVDNNENVLRLTPECDTIEKWLKTHETDGFTLDFFGGGYPQVLIEYINSKDDRIMSK